MNDSKEHTCLNCGYQHDTHFKYCPDCGQKNTDGKITFSELWVEFQDAFFNIESRTWKTFISIFTPGKLTNEYFSGKHRKYVHPLRVLLVSTLLLIIALSFQDVQSSTNHGYNIKDKILENHERLKLYRVLRKISKNTNIAFPDSNTVVITDTILNVFEDSLIHMLGRYGDRYGDSINLNYYIRSGFEGEETISKSDFLEMHEDSIVKKYKGDEGIIDQLIFKQKVKYVKDESQLASSMVDKLTLAVLLMMPFVALILFFLYYRKGFYYVENLIFTFHLHSFGFLVTTAWILCWNILPEWSIFIAIFAVQVYLFISLRNVYRQNLAWTIIKFIVINAFYVALFALFFLMTFWVSFLLL